jgi:hypothetical protein
MASASQATQPLGRKRCAFFDERSEKPIGDMAIQMSVRPRRRPGGSLAYPRARQPAGTFAEDAASGLAPRSEKAAMNVVSAGGARPVDVNGGIEASTDRSGKILRVEKIATVDVSDAI